MNILSSGKKPQCIFQYRKKSVQALILIIGHGDREKNEGISKSFRMIFPDAYYVLINKSADCVGWGCGQLNENVDYTGLYHIVLDVDVPSLYEGHPSCILLREGLRYIYGMFFKEFDTDLIIKANSGTTVPSSFTPETINSKKYNFFPTYGDVLDNIEFDSDIFTIPVFELKNFIDTISKVISTCSSTVLCAESTYRGIIPVDKINLHSR